MILRMRTCLILTGLCNNVIQFKSVSSKYLIKNEIQSEHGDVGYLNVFHLDCQGLNFSFNLLNEICELSTFQIIGLTETWLNNHNSPLLHIQDINFIIGIDNSDNMEEMEHILEAIVRFW